jgi:hypothetical protein
LGFDLQSGWKMMPQRGMRFPSPQPSPAKATGKYNRAAKILYRTVSIYRHGSTEKMASSRRGHPPETSPVQPLICQLISYLKK